MTKDVGDILGIRPCSQGSGFSFLSLLAATISIARDLLNVFDALDSSFISLKLSIIS